MENKYRNRIYKNYVTARSTSLAPDTINGLKPREPFLLHIINHLFPKEKNIQILDLGCGYGGLIYLAQKMGYQNIKGVDASMEQIQAAQKLGIRNVEQLDIFDTLKKELDGNLDVVITIDVIEHFNKNELITLIDEVQRVLKPGGRWIIHVPNGESPFASRNFFWDFTHELAFTHTSISQIMYASGFSKVQCFEDKPITHGIKSGIRRIGWEVIRLIFRFYLTIETGDFAKDTILSQNMLVLVIK